MRYIFIFLIFTLIGCQSNLHSERFLQNNDVRTPSYRMLAFFIESIKFKQEKKLFQTMLPIQSVKNFYELQYKANKGDAKSHYLLFLLYFDDSACSKNSLVNLKRVADENCKIALEHLNETVNIDPNFQLGLYKLAYFNQYGIGVDVNFNQSIAYWERLKETQGYYRELALTSAANIYFYEFNEIGKAKEYLTICAKEGGARCQFELNGWDNKMKLRPYILDAKNRERGLENSE
ncbi:hypothetical protein [Providencia vermicola]|uniref:hypothetical protein n=2 Tax=Providencia vermicola TaxID=333965 RepID=UPI001CEDACE2|nr:hypothetical protein [Providencia vermicola]